MSDDELDNLFQQARHEASQTRRNRRKSGIYQRGI
jgi:hypothetical protein